MDNILPTSDYKEVEGRAYVNPDVALNEANQFIDNLRATQDQQNQEIATQTQNLGTTLPSAQGGLGANTPNNLSYFTSRYQAPQTVSAVADLRSTAQAAALNQVLQDQQAMWKKRYQDAYRKYQKSAYDKANNPGGGGGDDDDTTKGGVDEVPTDDQVTMEYSSGVASVPGHTIVIGEDGEMFAENLTTGEKTHIRPENYQNGGSSGGGW